MSQMIREYEILGRIGKGGMATVYLARHIHLNTRVAIKVLNEEYSENESIRERFLNEARLLNTLKHPNIVEQKEFFQENGHFVLTMEYVEGRSLDEMIGQDIGAITWEKAIPLFMQILDGIGFAHKKGIIHRDIKPANILVSKSGKVKIADLGIAKVAGSKGLTKTGAKIGTIFYMSPEQVQGKEADFRSDIYSLGITLYETLAGKLPFGDSENTSEFEIMGKIVNGNLPDPRTFYPHIPQWAVAAITKATAVNPNERFQSCQEFAAYLTGNAEKLDMQTGFWSGQVAELGSMQLLKQSASPFDSSNSNTPVPPTSGADVCPECNATLEKSMVFCGECGADLTVRCPACSEKIRWNRKFCPKCGVNIKEKEIAQKLDLEGKLSEQRRRKEESERYQKAQKVKEQQKQAEEKKKTEQRDKKWKKEKRERKKRETARIEERDKIEVRREEIRLENLKADMENKLKRKQWWKKHWLYIAVPFFILLVAIPFAFPQHIPMFPSEMEFISIPSGDFQMGSPSSEHNRFSNESRHSVSVRSFDLMSTEVTQGMWEEVMGSNPSHFTGDSNRPVENVSWNDCQDFIDKLNDLDPNHTYRLPTEAEWEYACRAGTSDAYYWGNSSSESTMSSYCWYTVNSNSSTHPVGTKTPNSWGLYDMSGNVWEWCQDVYTSDYSDCPTNGRAYSGQGSYRVCRGGCWYSFARYCRSANRYNGSPGYRICGLGLRLARS